MKLGVVVGVFKRNHGGVDLKGPLVLQPSVSADSWGSAVSWWFYFKEINTQGGLAHEGNLQSVC